MHFFETGMILNKSEHDSLLYITPDPEEWLKDAIVERVKHSQNELVRSWQPKLFADSDIAELPANTEDLVHLIIARPDYKTRKQDVESSDSATLNLHNIYRWEQRIIGDDTVTLFPDGIDLEEIDCNYLNHCVDDISDWICGALLGQINRGKKRMIKEWQPIILDDPDIITMPATEDGLINMIVARDDYKAINN